MHKITMYEELRDKIDSEIDAINKKGITNENLDHLYKLSVSLKAVDKHIECLEEYEEHEEGYSGIRGRRRYSNDGWELKRIKDHPYSYNYPYERRYSRDNAKMKMVNKLETLMDDTMSEQERNAIRNCINEINMN